MNRRTVFDGTNLEGHENAALVNQAFVSDGMVTTCTPYCYKDLIADTREYGKYAHEVGIWRIKGVA